MKVAVLLALCALSASCAALQGEGSGAGAAGGPQDFGRRGPYAGLGLIQGFENFDTPGGVSADDSDVGIGLRGGMRLDRNWAVEGVLESVGGYEIDAGPFSEDLDMLTLGGQGKYYFSQEKVQPYAMAGLGLVRADIDNFNLDDSGTYFRIGGGADVYVNRDVAIFGELNINTLFGDVHDLDYFAFQIGVLWRF